MEASIDDSVKDNSAPPPKSSSVNYVAAILEEIALEGLDGITFEAAVKRLRRRWKTEGGGDDDRLAALVWSVARTQSGVRVYQLARGRPALQIIDRNDHVDESDLGVVIEPKNLPEDIYTFALVDDLERSGARGSCADFATREDVTADARPVEDARELRRRFGEARTVMVASQALRNEALLGPNMDPMLCEMLSAMEFCIVERIGRARDFGEVSHGKLSLQSMKRSPKDMFYHRKVLIKYGLIRKQKYYLKSNAKTQNFFGSLFHLPRFYVERHSKVLRLTHDLVSFLKQRPPHHLASYEDVKNFLNIGNVVKKFVKSAEFLRFIKPDIRVAYRTLFPDASEKEWRSKAKASQEGGEKMLRAMQLMDPDIDPQAVFATSADDTLDEDGLAADDDEAGGGGGGGLVGILDRSRWQVGKSVMRQACELLEEMGPDGISQQDLGKKMGLTKLEARAICRNFERRDLVISVMKDQGRQRTTHFVAKKFAHLCHASTELEKELHKNKKLVSEMRSTKKNKAKKSNAKQEFPCGTQVEPEPVEVSFVSNVDDSEQPAAGQGFSSERKKGGMTERQLKRINIIVDAVREHKVIDDPTKVFKIIKETEAEEGYDGKMDKKSLQRILTRLAAEGQIKNILVKLSFGERNKTLHFICDPGIEEGDEIIRSAVERAKMKFQIVPKRLMAAAAKQAKKESQDDSLVEGEGDQESIKKEAQASPQRKKIVHDKRWQRVYGLLPRFASMRELHCLLFYLTRCYAGDTDLDKEEALAAIRKEAGSSFDVEIESHLQRTDIFTKRLSWRSFIPPLPTHEGWGEGWCLISDVLVRLPLSIFVKLVSLTYEVEGLEAYLNHPVKRHFLVRSLPQRMLDRLLYQRKYIFCAHKIATWLSYLGLVQFAPQTLKEKDQVFIYLNRRASLIDTTTCRPAYHIAEPGEGMEPFPARSYDLIGNSASDLGKVEQYWYDMWDVCISTPLNRRHAGESVTIENMEAKMAETLKPRACDEVEARDLGEIPGDHKGAAGFDSSMFAHLKRNWSWTSTTKGPGLKKSASATATEGANQSPKPRKRKKTSETKESSPSVPVIDFAPVSKRAKKDSVKRIIQSRKKHSDRKPYYDEKDKEALKLMRKLRVDWSDQEDSFLLICKVAGAYLCQNSRSGMVNYTAVRDILHKHFSESQNKTSRACQRRLNYMLKNGTTADNVRLFLADVQRDTTITGRFLVPSAGELSRTDNDDRLERDFEPLVDVLVEKYKGRGGPEADTLLPRHIDELNAKFDIIFPVSSTSEAEQPFADPRDIKDIRGAVVNALITSSLSSASDKTSYSFQLFKIYQQYPDSLLRSVMNQLRTRKMVSLKKTFKRDLDKRSVVPLSSSPYQLSVSFAHKFLSRYQYDIYEQSWHMVKRLLIDGVALGEGWEGTELVIGQEGGYAAAIVALMARGRISFSTEVPDQLVVLDPNLAAVDDQYVRVLQRYKDLLRESGAMDERDIAVMHSAAASGPSKLPTSNDLFKKRAEKSANDRKRTSASDPSSSAATTSANGGPVKRLRLADDDGEAADEIVFQDATQSAPGSGDAPEGGVGGDSGGRAVTQVAKSASRIALYMMRENEPGARASEKLEKGGRGKDPVQHSHDFFVISSCKVNAKFKERLDITQSEDRLCIQSGSRRQSAIEVDKNLVPGDVKASERVLKHFGYDHTGAAKPKDNRMCIPKGAPDFEAWLADQAPTAADEALLREVYDVVCEGKELGVSGRRLRELSAEDVRVSAAVLKLTEAFHVIKAGVSTTTFIGRPFASPWLLHSFRVTRVRMREGNAGFRQDAAGCLMDTESSEVLHKNKRGQRVASESKADVAAASASAAPAGSGKVDWSKVEELDVLLRPWLRIDGSLNRRVFDRLLGAVLGQIMQRPGQRIAHTCNRFSPALQPVHCRDLVDFLAELGCVSLFRVSTAGQSSLFGPRPAVSMVAASVLDDADDVVTEPSVDAVVRLGQFIGDKKYTVDFVCQCPCHPDKHL